MDAPVSTFSTSLERLPPEILRLILERMPHVNVLHNLIRASPYGFQIYQRYKTSILSHVVRNQIPTAILSIAVNALEQRKLRGPRRPRGAVLEYLKNLGNDSNRRAHQFPMEVSRSLLQFDDITEYFISDFTRDRLTVIRNYLQGVASEVSPLKTTAVKTLYSDIYIAKSEHARLARAFYLMELFGHLFYRPTSPEDEITSAEQSTLFLQCLRDWELEEFLCVRSYLKEKLTNYLNQVEDDLMQEFLEDGPCILEPNNYNDRWEEEDFFFSDVAHNSLQDIWIENCLTRGLRTLKAMFTAEAPEDRFEVLGHTHYVTNHITRALSTMPGYPYQPRHELLELVENYNCLHDIERPNEGWWWSMIGGHPRNCMDYANDPSLEGLRRTGYMIWGRERLQSLGILNVRYVCCLATHQLSLLVYETDSSYHRNDKLSLDCGEARPRRHKLSVESRTRIQEQLWERQRLLGIE